MYIILKYMYYPNKDKLIEEQNHMDTKIRWMHYAFIFVEHLFPLQQIKNAYIYINLIKKVNIVWRKPDQWFLYIRPEKRQLIYVLG